MVKDEWVAYSTSLTTSTPAESGNPLSMQGNVFTRSLSDYDTTAVVVPILGFGLICVIIASICLVRRGRRPRQNRPRNRSSILTILQQNGFMSADEVPRARRHNQDNEASRPEDNHDLQTRSGNQHEREQPPIELRSVLVSRPLDVHTSQGRESVVSPTRNRFAAPNRTP